MSKQEEPRGFLNRWSTRKQAAEQATEQTETPEQVPAEVQLSGSDDVPVPLSSPLEAPEPILQPVSEGETDVNADALAAVPEAEQAGELVLSDADMPAIETLTASSDVSAFFNKGVSAALRKAALRHVFRQSSFNVRDGLNDYDGDFTSFEPLGDTVTADMKFHAARKEKARLEAERAAQEEARLEAERAAREEEARLEAENTDQNTDQNTEQNDDTCREDDELAGQDDAHAGAEGAVQDDVERGAANAVEQPLAERDDSAGPLAAADRDSARTEPRPTD